MSVDLNSKEIKKNSKGSSATKPVYLVDGSGYIFRAYYALPSLTRKSDGCPTGAVYGFCNMLQKLLSDIERAGGSGHIAILFDSSRKTFRNKIYPDYKAHRPPPPEDLIPQFQLIQDAVNKFNISSIKMDGFEADDLIASYTRKSLEEGHEVIIVSSDKDLMQLIGDGVLLHDPLKGKMIGRKEVHDKFGVYPEQVVDLQSLAGDSSDNVPGVPGIGIKTAAELLNNYQNLDNLLDNAAEIKQPKRRQNLIDYADLARISRDLVRLRDDLPIEGSIDEIKVRELNQEDLFEWLKTMEFENLANKLRLKYGQEDRYSETKTQQKNEFVRNYNEVKNIKQLNKILHDSKNIGVLAVSVELDREGGNSDNIVGIGLCTELNESWYLSFKNFSYEKDLINIIKEEKNHLTYKDIYEFCLDIFEDPSVIKITQNAKNLISFFDKFNINIVSLNDLSLISFVLGGGKYSHDLMSIAERVVSFNVSDRKKVLGSGKSAIKFSDAPSDITLEIAAGNAEAIFRVFPIFKTEILSNQLVNIYETVERPLVHILVNMERSGIKVDNQKLLTLSEEFLVRMNKAELSAYKLAGHKFNLGSPKQLGEVLFDEMNLVGGRKTKNGSWSTDADILETLSSEGYELPEVILDWRHVAKLRSTYTEALSKQINDVTGRVHTNFVMTGTATGRLASNNPNLQNIPVRSEEGRRIRQAFIAEKGNVLVSADYSQIELRLLAHIAEIKPLIKVFRDGGDVHSITASQVFDVKLENMDTEIRRNAKAINFGIIYGISPFGLSRQLRIPQTEAKQYIDSYFARYPGIKDYMDKAKIFSREHGYVMSLLGRRIYIPGILDKNHNLRSFSERASINAPLQGSAADIMKLAIIRMHKSLEKSKLRAKMVLSVHDELLFEVAESDSIDLCALVKEQMESVISLEVPLVVDTGIGQNWSEAH